MAGNLTAVISADTSGLKRNVTEAQQILERYRGTASQAARDSVGLSESQVNAYNRVVNALRKVENGSMSLTQQEKALQTQIRELRAQYANLSDTAKNSDFGRQLSQSCNTAKTQLQQLRTQMKSLDTDTKKVNTTSKEFSGNLDGLVGVVGKYFAALQAGKMVLDTLKDAFFASEENIDEWGRTVDGAKAAYNTFVHTLNSGNWNNFFKNLTNAIQGARELYDSLDRLGSIKQNNVAAIAIVETELAKLRVLKQQGKNVDDQIKAKEQELRNLKMQEVEQGKKTGLDQMREAIQTQDGNVSDAMAEKIANMIIQKGQGAYDFMGSEVARLLEKAGTKTVTKTSAYGFGEGTDTYTTTEEVVALENLTDTEKQLLKAYQAAISAETPIADGLKTVASAYSLEGSISQSQYKYNRWSGSGGKGGQPTAEQYSQHYQKLASEAIDPWKEINDALDSRNKGQADIGLISEEDLDILGEYDQAMLQNTKTIEAYNKAQEEAIEAERERIADLEEMTNVANGLSSTLSSVSTIIGAIGGSDNPFATIMSGAAQALPQVAALVSAMSALSVAKGTASATNWIEMLAAAAAITSTMITTIAAVKNRTKGYAEGGIITGPTSIGDYNLVRANGGEMMLNMRQQSNLFRLINNGYTGGDYGNPHNVLFKQRGADIYGVMDTYLQRQNKVR